MWSHLLDAWHPLDASSHRSPWSPPSPGVTPALPGKITAHGPCHHRRTHLNARGRSRSRSRIQRWSCPRTQRLSRPCGRCEAPAPARRLRDPPRCGQQLHPPNQLGRVLAASVRPTRYRLPSEGETGRGQQSGLSDPSRGADRAVTTGRSCCRPRRTRACCSDRGAHGERCPQRACRRSEGRGPSHLFRRA